LHKVFSKWGEDVENHYLPSAAQKLSIEDGSSDDMIESNPTNLFFHFHRTGSDTVDTRETRCGGLLHGLRRQRNTNATANAQRQNLGTLALALARHS